MKIFIGADHRGFLLKEKVVKWLFEMGSIEIVDVGATHLDPNDDYPIFAQEVASLVADNKDTLGILLCGSGVGVEVVANKIDGVRASVGKNAEQVKAGRSDDDLNILVLASDYTSEEEAKDMVKDFVETEFSGKERYKRRIEDIKRIEVNN